MKACVLIAAPQERMEDLVRSVPDFDTLRVADAGRAELLARIGCFQAIVVAEGFVRGLDDVAESPIVVVGPQTPLESLSELVEEAVEHRRAIDHRSSDELASLTVLPYATYLELVTFRATRRYLLGLMRRHRGSVTEASVAAGLARESLHRQLRRHGVDADAFRDTDSP